jgi:hypothetical protein
MIGDSGIRPEFFIKSLALYLGSFLMPKFVIKGLQVSEPNKVVLRDAKTGKLTITNKTSGLLRSLYKAQTNGTVSIKNFDIYGEEFTRDLVSSSTEARFSIYQITDDFFGVFKNQNINCKKIQVLDIYKLMFRFSVGKLIMYLSRPEFIVVIL